MNGDTRGKLNTGTKEFLTLLLLSNALSPSLLVFKCATTNSLFLIGMKGLPGFRYCELMNDSVTHIIT